MNLEKAVEAIIKEAMERGEFENLPGKGKSIDLSAYFDAPEGVRMAHSVLKNAGMTPREVDLWKEIAELKQILATLLDEQKKQELQEQIQQKQVEFSLLMERQKKERKQREAQRCQHRLGKRWRFDCKSRPYRGRLSAQREVRFTNHSCPAILGVVEVDFLGAQAPFVWNNRMWYVHIPREQVSEGLFLLRP